MKTIIKILLIGLLLNGTAKGQCIENMPNDTAFCLDSQSTTNVSLFPWTINSNPTLVGGVAPFVFTWSITPIYTNLWPQPWGYLHASAFLDDTTLQNPVISGIEGESLIFYLTITDANGFSCIDSVIVRANSFGYTAFDPTIAISFGDSAEMCAPYYGGSSPYTFLWNPTIYLSDSSVECPMVVVPSSSLSYSVTVTDISGCVGNYYHHLSYGPTGVLEIKEDKFLMKCLNYH